MLARTRVALCITTQGITLWLLGTTRTMGAIMVAIDGTFIVTGSILVLICVNADAEVTHLTSPRLGRRALPRGSKRKGVQGGWLGLR